MLGAAHHPARVFIEGVSALSPFRSAAHNAEDWSFNSTSLSCAFSRTKKQRGGASCLRNPAHYLPPGLRSWAASAAWQKHRRKGRGSLCCMSSLGFEVTPATIVVLSCALSFAVLRTFIYLRMEYIIAAMLGRHIPRGGAKVVELNIRGGRNLYYYPSDTVQVVAVSSKPNMQLLENQAVRAGVPIKIVTQGPSALGLPSSSVDAVASILCLHDIPDREVVGVLREAVRVLKPGKPLIFVESVGAKNAIIRSSQSLLATLLNLAGSKKAVRDLLPYIEEVEDLDNLQFEEVFGWVDPHFVGIAKKKTSVVNEPNKEVKKGFKKSKV